MLSSSLTFNFSVWTISSTYTSTTTYFQFPNFYIQVGPHSWLYSLIYLTSFRIKTWSQSCLNFNMPNELIVFSSLTFTSSVLLTSMTTHTQARNRGVIPKSALTFLPPHNHSMLESCPKSTLNILIRVLFSLIHCHISNSPSLDQLFLVIKLPQ